MRNPRVITEGMAVAARSRSIGRIMRLNWIISCILCAMVVLGDGGGLLIGVCGSHGNGAAAAGSDTAVAGAGACSATPGQTATDTCEAADTAADAAEGVEEEPDALPIEPVPLDAAALSKGGPEEAQHAPTGMNVYYWWLRKTDEGTQLTAQEFSARPGVVRRGASKWPATQLWTYDYLRKDGGVGHARVDAVDASSLASQASTHLSGRLRDVWDEAAKPGWLAKGMVPDNALRDLALPPFLSHPIVSDSVRNVTFVVVPTGRSALQLTEASNNEVTCLVRGESADIFFVLPGFEDDAYWDDAKGKSDVDVRDVDAAAHPRVQHLQFKEARLARGDCVVVPATTVYWASLPTMSVLVTIEASLHSQWRHWTSLRVPNEGNDALPFHRVLTEAHGDVFDAVLTSAWELCELSELPEDERTALVPKACVARLFEQLDTDGSEAISAQEFVAATQTMAHGARTALEWAKLAVALFDGDWTAGSDDARRWHGDGSGDVSLPELQRALRRVAWRRRAGGRLPQAKLDIMDGIYEAGDAGMGDQSGPEVDDVTREMTRELERAQAEGRVKTEAELAAEAEQWRQQNLEM